MYSVSYFCTKMHHFKAKIPKKIPHRARKATLVGLRPLCCPSPIWNPQMKFLAMALVALAQFLTVRGGDEFPWHRMGLWCDCSRIHSFSVRTNRRKYTRISQNF